MALDTPFLYSRKINDWVTGLLYGFRYYNPSTGRWLSRDPIGERGGVNLYGFVNNAPIGLIDTDGRGIWGKSDPCAEFEKCYQDEKKDTSWMKDLPNCPCSIKVEKKCLTAQGGGPGGGGAANIDVLTVVSSDEDAGWGLDPGVITDVTGRSGAAAHCIRSKAKTQGGPRQECCYDSKGKLITGGRGAGTVDRGSGGILDWGHISADVTPYRLAVKCDKIKGGNSCLQKYLEVRPINNGNKCENNEPR